MTLDIICALYGQREVASDPSRASEVVTRVIKRRLRQDFARSIDFPFNTPSAFVVVPTGVGVGPSSSSSSLGPHPRMLSHSRGKPKHEVLKKHRIVGEEAESSAKASLVSSRHAASIDVRAKPHDETPCRDNGCHSRACSTLIRHQLDTTSTLV